MTSLEEIVASRLAEEAVKVVRETVRGAFCNTEFDPDEVFGPMDPRQAAEFLKLPYKSFRELAPSLPRHRVTPQKIVYFRAELLEWLRER